MFGLPSLQTIVYVAVAVSATSAGFLLYDRLIDDPHVRELARAGYVTEATQAALQAELNETRRQREAAQRSSDAWMGRYNVFVTDQEKQDVEDAKDTTELEAKVAAAGDSCKLQPYQRDQLLKRR